MGGGTVRLGRAEASPLPTLKISNDKTVKKPHLTDEEIVKIKAEPPEEPEGMQTAFEITLHTGRRCRRGGFLWAASILQRT
jgi:hypothetical protein